ncbi:hypothetical protein EYF80_029585 [Liparis tanakae]|uniref:Uncharacterized protein n=1 Tax=Liparis tanakae TaxID=230148 RepID=A0A4Z2H5F9_9TELE|nr:hypothetical protein EYF80_029585 [Liparis tanakae]
MDQYVPLGAVRGFLVRSVAVPMNMLRPRSSRLFLSVSRKASMNSSMSMLPSWLRSMVTTRSEMVSSVDAQQLPGLPEVVNGDEALAEEEEEEEEAEEEEEEEEEGEGGDQLVAQHPPGEAEVHHALHGGGPVVQTHQTWRRLINEATPGLAQRPAVTKREDVGASAGPPVSELTFRLWQNS